MRTVCILLRRNVKLFFMVAAQVAQGVDDAYVACRDCLLHCRRGKKIADQHSYVVVPYGVDGRSVATGHRVVDYVVVDKRGIM
ncbi:MAG: hypothetical protein J6B55_02955 [Clostridia bacterium]|nr:hypothetical protein [Clostridia bacterium]